MTSNMPSYVYDQFLRYYIYVSKNSMDVSKSISNVILHEEVEIEYTYDPTGARARVSTQ